MAVNDGRGGFRLERVLEHRKRQTEEAQQALAARAVERSQAEAALDRLASERGALVDYLSRLSGADLDVAALAAAEEYARHLRLSVDEQARAVREAQAREEEARSLLLERKVDQGVLERLRDRALQERVARERASEALLLDEIATTRASGRHRAVGGA